MRNPYHTKVRALLNVAKHLQSTRVFVLFSPVQNNFFSFDNANVSSVMFLPIKTFKTSDEITVHDGFSAPFLKNFRFHLSTLEMQRFKETRFQNVPVLEPS